MNINNPNHNSNQWPHPTELLSKLKKPSTLHRKWINIKVTDFRKLLSTCLHDETLREDTIIIEIVLSQNFQEFVSIEIIRHDNLFTKIDSYHSDDINELIKNEIVDRQQNIYCHTLACQIYGDIWLIQ